MWDIKEKEKDFILKYIDSESVKKIDNDDLTIDAFFKSKTSVKKAKFALIKGLSNYLFINFIVNTDFIIENQEVDKSKKKNYQSKDMLSVRILEKFFHKFVGSASFMNKKIEKIENEKNKSSNDVTKVVKSPINFTNLFYFIKFALFFIFTLLSLIRMRPSDTSFLMNLSFTRTFNKFNTGYLSPPTLKLDIMSKLSSLFMYNDPVNGTFLNAPIGLNNAQINTIRMTVYKSDQISCPGVILLPTNYTCFYPLYSIDMADTTNSCPYIASAKCKYIFN